MTAWCQLQGYCVPLATVPQMRILIQGNVRKCLKFLSTVVLLLFVAGSDRSDVIRRLGDRHSQLSATPAHATQVHSSVVCAGAHERAQWRQRWVRSRCTCACCDRLSIKNVWSDDAVFPGACHCWITWSVLMNTGSQGFRNLVILNWKDCDFRLIQQVFDDFIDL